MALLLFEGFDAYNTSTQLVQQANVAEGSSSIVTTTPRTGRASLSISVSAFARFGFAMTGSNIVIGAGVRWQNSSSNQRPFRTFATATNRSGIGFQINASGNLVVGVGGPTVGTASTVAFGTVLWTGTDIEPTGTWIHYELKATLSGTATGSWTLRRNGQVVQAQSSVITLANAADVITALVIEGMNATSPFSIDDLYVCDGSGTLNNDFLGPVRVNNLRPTANSSVAWTPNTGANWDAVDDITPDDDTTYVSAGSVLTDMYTIADLPASAAIVRGVRAIYRARKEDAATVEARLRILSGAVEALGPVNALDTTYTYYVAYFPTDPNTGLAWTPAAVNALTAGMRRVT